MAQSEKEVEGITKALIGLRTQQSSTPGGPSDQGLCILPTPSSADDKKQPAPLSAATAFTSAQSVEKHQNDLPTPALVGNREHPSVESGAASSNSPSRPVTSGGNIFRHRDVTKADDALLDHALSDSLEDARPAAPHQAAPSLTAPAAHTTRPRKSSLPRGVQPWAPPSGEELFRYKAHV